MSSSTMKRERPAWRSVPTAIRGTTAFIRPGKLRLTRFDGPDVFSWKVLERAPSPHYKPGRWNQLRVRIADGKISCYRQRSTSDRGQAVATCGRQNRAGQISRHAGGVQEFSRGSKPRRRGTSGGSLARGLESLSIPCLPATNSKTRLPLWPRKLPQATYCASGPSRSTSGPRQLRRLAQQLHEHRVVTELSEVLSKGEEAVDLSPSGSAGRQTRQRGTRRRRLRGRIASHGPRNRR